MRETILSLNENGSKQYESSRFSYMEALPNMEGFFLNKKSLGVTENQNFSTKFCRPNGSCCVKLFPAFFQ